MSEEGQRLAAGNFTLTGVLAEGKRQISMTGYVYSDDTADEINKRLDRFQDAIDRQVLRAEMKIKEDEIKRNEAGIEQLAQHYESLVRRKNTGKKLTSQELDQMDKYDSSVQFLRRSNEAARQAIADHKKRLNGAA